MAKVKAPTKRENFEVIKAFLMEHGKTDLADVMSHEIELLSRKGSKGGSLTPEQKENLALCDIIKDILIECSNPNGMTVGEILKCPNIAGFETANPNGVTSQRVTGILSNRTVDKGGSDFVRTLVKRVAYYRLAWDADLTAPSEEVEGE